MRPVVKSKLKRVVSILICVMMVAATFPVHMLNGAVFAEEDGLEIHLSQGNLSSGLQNILNIDENTINIVLDEDIEIAPGSSGMSGGSFFDFKSDEKFANKTINIMSNKNKKDGPFKITNKSQEMSLLEAKGCCVCLENVKFDGANVEGTKNFIDLSFNATLTLKDAAVVQNVKRAGYSSAIALDFCSKLFLAGGSVCGFAGAQGSAISANNGSLVDMDKDSQITNCVTCGYGGAIFVGLSSSLDLKSGNISECSSQWLGDAVFFDSDGEYKVAPPNKKLKISIPENLDNSHNSDPRVVGYVGIYKVGIDRKVASEEQCVYYMAQMNADGGVDGNGVKPANWLFIPKKADDGTTILDRPVLDYLPKDLKRDDVLVSGWTYNDAAEKAITNKTKISDIFLNFGVIIKFTPKYELKNAEVSTCDELKHAVDNSGDNCKITLKDDINIDSTICVDENKNILIESPQDEVHTLTVDQSSTFITATQGNVTLKDVVLEGGAAQDFELYGGDSSEKYLFSVTNGANIRLDSLVFKNYSNEGGGRRLIYVEGANLDLVNCYFENCGVDKNSGDAFGGVLHAVGKCEVTMTDCTIKNCYAKSSKGKAYGGAIYLGAEAKLAIKGGSITGCYVSSNLEDGALGDCIYCDKEGTLEECLVFDSDSAPKITFNKELGSQSHNSYFGYIGYLGVYKKDVSIQELTEEDKKTALQNSVGVNTNNIVISLDFDGGVDLDGNEPVSMLCFAGGSTDKIFDYLPTFLKKGDQLLSGWKYGENVAVDSNTAVTTVVSNGSSKVTASYASNKDVSVDNYAELQEAIYNAEGVCTITLTKDIAIENDDSQYPLAKSRLSKASSEEVFPNAKEKYCFSDDSSKLYKEIIIKGNGKSITLKQDAGLIALQHGILTLEDITLNVADVDQFTEGDYISVEKGAILNINSGAKIQNFVGNGVNAIRSEGATVNVNSGGSIEHCCVENGSDLNYYEYKPNEGDAAENERFGGAIYAILGSTVNISGSIKNCSVQPDSQGGVCRSIGGAIYALDSNVNIIDGSIIEKCFCKSSSGLLCGGAIAADRSTVIMSGGSIKECFCEGQTSITIDGGAISVWGDGGKFVMAGGAIEDCYCLRSSKNGANADPSTHYICGGGVCVADEDAKNPDLVLKAGKIVGCYAKAENADVDAAIAQGDCVYFEGEGCYQAVNPGGALTILIDSEKGQKTHNSDPKYVGYPGIWKAVAEDAVPAFCEILIDVDGGVCNDGRAYGDKIAIPTKDDNGVETKANPIFNYLPELRKGNARISGWSYKNSKGDWVNITEETTVEEIVSLENVQLKAVYYVKTVEVSSYDELQRVVYEAKGYIIIILKKDIVIGDSDSNVKSASEVKNSDGEQRYPNALDGYFLCDNNESYKEIVVKSEEGSIHTIRFERKDLNFLFLGNGTFRFEYVTIDGGTDSDISGGGVNDDSNSVPLLQGEGVSLSFVYVSDGSTLDLGSGVSFQNVSRGDCSSIMISNQSTLLLNGCSIKNCGCVTTGKDAKGGFVNLTKGGIFKAVGTKFEECYCSSNKNAYGGLIYSDNGSIYMKDCDVRSCFCRAESKRAYGGLIYAKDSKLNVESGFISGCEVSTYSHGTPDLKGDVIYFKGNADDCRICPPNNGLKMTVPLGYNSHNSDAKVVGYWGIYLDSVPVSQADDSKLKYYEIPIDACGSVDRDLDKNANPVYVDRSSLDEPILKYLPTNDRTRQSDGAEISGWQTEDGEEITQTTTVKDILSSNGRVTKTLKPIYDNSKFRVSDYLKLQNAMYTASGDVTITLDSDIEILDNDDYPDSSHSIAKCCFADDPAKSKNIVIKSADASNPKKIINKKKDSRLFVLQNGSLTFRDIVLDAGAVYDRTADDYSLAPKGNCLKGNVEFILISNATLNLESGAVIQNVYRVFENASVLRAQGGSTINLNAGSSITDCILFSSGVVCGCAISSIKSTVNMNGGLINNCQIDNQGTDSDSDYAHGAAIYSDQDSSLNLQSGNILRCSVNCGAVGNAKGDAIYFANKDLSKCQVAQPNGNLKIEIPLDLDNSHNTDAHVVGYRGIFMEANKSSANLYYELMLRELGAEDGPNGYLYVSVSAVNDYIKKHLPNKIEPNGEPIVSWHYGVEDENGNRILVDNKTKLKTVLGGEKSADLWFECYAEQEHVSSYEQLQKAIYKARENKEIILDNDITIESSNDYPDASDVKDKDGVNRSYPNADSGFCFCDDKDITQKITIKSADGKNYTIKSEKDASGLFLISNGVLSLENVTLDGGATYTASGAAATGCLKRTADFIKILKQSTLNINQNATIQNVYRASICNAIRVKNSNININDGTITGCKAALSGYDNVYGGAMYLTGGSGVVMNGGSITNCSVASASSSAGGGAIYIDSTSRLSLKRGVISGCSASTFGDAIYFGSSDSKYDVALPGSGLTITIPMTDAKNSRNSDARIVGYQGIYKNSLGNRSATVDDFLYYELNVDLNGGVGADGNSSLSAIYISKNANNFYVLNYLPNDLKKDNVKLSGWECECLKVLERATVFSFLENEDSLSTKVLKASYDFSEEHVSTYWELQYAIYYAQGTKTIFLDQDINIGDDIDEIGQSVYIDAADVVGSSGQKLYPNAEKGYSLSDNKLLTNRSITIKSSGNELFKIKHQKKDSGLLVLRGSMIKFENVIIEGDNVLRNQNFIDASKYSTIEVGKGAVVQNVKVSGKYFVIYLDKSMLTLEEFSAITNCCATVSGAIYATDNSEVILRGGYISKCSGEKGGAICAINSKLNLQSGEISKCQAKNNGDAIYFSGNDGDYNVAKPAGALKITHSLSNNNHNSDARVVGYWGIYKNGVGQREPEGKWKFYEVIVDANGGVDEDGNSYVSPIYISMQSRGEDVAILPYLPKNLTNKTAKLVKWVYNDGLENKEVDENTKLINKYDKITVIIKKVKAVYDTK